MDGSTELDAWLARFVQSSLREEAVEEFTAAVDTEILRTLPELAADPVLVEDLGRSTRHQWLSFLTSLGKPEHELVLPSQAGDLARSLARRGMEVRVLVRVYLNAHHGVFTYLSESVDRLTAEHGAPEDALRVLWRRADLWMDESIETLMEAFFEERERELAGSAVQRAELVDAIVAGEEVDLERASASLTHPLHLCQTAFLVWSDSVDQHTPIVLQSAAEEVARCLDAGALLTQLSGSRDLRCWVATPSPPSAECLARVEAPSAPELATALGRPAQGLEGFRVSHLDARSAQHLALSAELSPRLVDYREVELLCLALADGAALRRMVRREVGPLCGADKNLAPVRETVLTYLANSMNVEATAERLFVHGNTVRYRLTKAEELLGFQIAQRPRHVELALQYVAYFGPPLD